MRTLLVLPLLLLAAGTMPAVAADSEASQAITESGQTSAHGSASAAHALVGSGQAVSAVAAVPLAIGGAALSATGAVSMGAAGASAQAASARPGAALPVTDETVVTVPPDRALQSPGYMRFIMPRMLRSWHAWAGRWPICRRACTSPTWLLRCTPTSPPPISARFPAM